MKSIFDKSIKNTVATFLDKATFEKFKKYLKGMNWYDKRYVSAFVITNDNDDKGTEP